MGMMAQEDKLNEELSKEGLTLIPVATLCEWFDNHPKVKLLIMAVAGISEKEKDNYRRHGLDKAIKELEGLFKQAKRQRDKTFDWDALLAQLNSPQGRNFISDCLYLSN